VREDFFPANEGPQDTALQAAAIERRVGRTRTQMLAFAQPRLARIKQDQVCRSTFGETALRKSEHIRWPASDRRKRFQQAERTVMDEAEHGGQNRFKSRRAESGFTERQAFFFRWLRVMRGNDGIDFATLQGVDQTEPCFLVPEGRIDFAVGQVVPDVQFIEEEAMGGGGGEDLCASRACSPGDFDRRVLSKPDP
jgi:hypothetical protein